MKRLALIAMLALTGCHKHHLPLISLDKPVNPAMTAPGAQIFGAGGQSNMPGHIADFVRLVQTMQILAYGMDHKIKVAADPIWDCASPGANEPDVCDGSEGYGTSPAHYFALQYIQRYPQAQVLIVPTARGGTSIDAWAPGTPLYNAQIRRLREAIAASKGGRFMGFLWWQGEQDYYDEAHATTWAGKFTDMINSMRAELGNFPVVYVQIASEGPAGQVAPFRETLRQNQATVSLMNCRMINAEDLGPHDGDGFYNEGYAKMGVRFLGAMADLLEGD